MRHGTFELARRHSQLRREARHADAGLGSDGSTKTFSERRDFGLRSTRAAEVRSPTGGGRRSFPHRRPPRSRSGRLPVDTFNDGEQRRALGVEVRPQKRLKLLVHVLEGG